MNRPRLFAVIFACCCAGVANAEEDRAADRAAILKNADAYVEAFNRGDAAAVAAQWSENAVYINRTTGQRLNGRDAIQLEFAELLAREEKPQMQVKVGSVRFLTEDVAVEDGTAKFLIPGQPPEETAYTAIHVKKDGKWLVDSVREVSTPVAASHYEHLKDLEWMIGEWIDENESGTIETTYEWTKNRNFISQSFAVSVQNKIQLEGTQIIGWDPVAKQIRSWVFDTDGGSGESVWSRDEKRWIVKMNATLSGGVRASAVNIITMVDDNSFLWQSVSREHDGELLPNIDPVTVRRKAAQ